MKSPFSKWLYKKYGIVAKNTDRATQMIYYKEFKGLDRSPIDFHSIPRN